jgi:hypothetical protein
MPRRMSVWPVAIHIDENGGGLGYGFERLGNEQIRRIVSSVFEIRAGRKIILIASSMSGSSARPGSVTRSMPKPFEGRGREHLANQDPA